MKNPEIIVVGAGFGGLNAASALASLPVHLTVIDKNNHHLFQPLLYQVATAGLSPADISSPIRSILRSYANIEVIMAELSEIKPDAKMIKCGSLQFEYEFLVLATGASNNYFAHPEWSTWAPSLKTLEDATRIRRRILIAFERAEVEKDPERQRELLTFVLVGGGPTGTEMAGAIAELARKAMACDFRHIDPKKARIVLVEAGPRILANFPEHLSKKATDELQRLGVEILANTKVSDITADGAKLGESWVATPNIFWTAGVLATPIGKMLGAQMDSAGRILVEPNLSLPGHRNIFVIGDLARCLDEKGRPLPGLAPVAIQQGRYLRTVIQDRLAGRVSKPFRYHDKGNLATIGRSSAIAEIGKIQMSGFPAWMLWLVVHIIYLIGFRNRILVLIEWAWSYFTFQRGARLITGDPSKTSS